MYIFTLLCSKMHVQIKDLIFFKSRLHIHWRYEIIVLKCFTGFWGILTVEIRCVQYCYTGKTLCPVCDPVGSSFELILSTPYLSNNLATMWINVEVL